MKKFSALCSTAVIAVLSLFFSGCGNSKVNNTSAETQSKTFSVGMVTDGNSVNDQSFNQSTWLGLSDFSAKTGAHASYIESVQASDYATNLNKYSDENVDLIWGVGFEIADALLQEAKNNPEQKYAIVDYSYGNETPQNVTCLIFKDNESAFLGGVAAAATTKSNKIGFVGGMKSQIIDRFEYGFTAGAHYAAKQLNKEVDVESNYLESFMDTAKAKATAIKMFSNGADVIFQACGGAGTGVIEAAKESNKFAVGVDMDQAYIAPKNVLCSVVKHVNKAVEDVTTKVYNSENLGGVSLTLGLAEECVGLTQDNPNMGEKAKKLVAETIEKIRNGEINPPQSEAEYKMWRRNVLQC